MKNSSDKTELCRCENFTINVAKILRFMKQDKKVVGNNINLILLKDIGNGFIEREVSFKKLEQFLQSHLS